MSDRYLDVPFHLDGRGRTGVTGDDDHIRDLVFQVLFTSPGERVNRPDFGCGLKTLLFRPNSSPLAAATKLLVQGSLQKWLEQEIAVEGVEVEAIEERLTVTVAYTRRDTGERLVEEFVR
jgi:phage baseplate assembly protein W